MKSFIAADMRTALRMVREEFGDDAVILSNRRVPQGIELVAAAEMPPAPPPVVAPSPNVAPAREYGEIETAECSRGDNGWYQMQQELRLMRDMIEQQYANFTWQQYRVEKPAQAAMWRRLQRLGLDAEAVRELFAIDAQDAESKARSDGSAKEDWQRLMARLSARIPVCTGDLIEGGGIFAFVGPTGVGKTTTIGKLAARYVLDHGNSDIALVTTDCYRIGAHEQLRTLARILNVPCKIVSGQRDLVSALYEVRHCKVVLIDSAGLNAHSPELGQQLAALDALGERVQVVQVLAANGQLQALRNAQRVYRTGNLRACIFTKLDEACSLGEMISLLVTRHLPLAYVADGQAIPGNLAVGNGRTLVARAIELAKHSEGDEARLAQIFAQQGGRLSA